MAMARPMGRPSGPPFALITAVVLFVIATAAAIILYTEATKAREEVAPLKKQATDADAKADDAIAAYKTLRDKVDRAGDQDTTAVAAERLVTSLNKRLAAIKVPGKEETFATYPLIKAVEMMDEHRAAEAVAVASVEQAVQPYKTQVAALQTNLADVKAKLGKLEEEDATARGALTKKHQAELEDRDKEVAKQTAEKADLKKQLDEMQMKRIADNDDWKVKYDTLKRENDQLKREIFKMARDPALIHEATWKPVRLVDGAVVQVFPEQNLAYLDLARPEQAKLGMRYVIHSKDKPIPIPQDTKGKGIVEISSLEGGSIQARIIKSSPTDPILVGDAVVNPVVGPRTVKFVVFGEFDLNNDGVLEPNGKAQLEALLTRWGGQVQKAIDLTTTVVVLGEQPQVPPKPLPGADPLLIKKYEEALEEHEAWAKLHDRAIQYTIPIFNTTTILTLIGFFNEDTGPGSQRRVRPGEDYFPPS